MIQFLYEFLCNSLCENMTYEIKTYLVGDIIPKKIQSKTIEEYEYEFDMKMRGKNRWRKVGNLRFPYDPSLCREPTVPLRPLP